jgi:F420-non-reducing hydrogenase small subunit
MPCTGCGGATPNQPEVGAGMITALASILGTDKEPGQYTDEDIEQLMNQIKDPVGTFYMYSLPASILKRKVIKK